MRSGWSDGHTRWAGVFFCGRGGARPQASSREEALRWAVDDMGPGWVVDGEVTARGLGDLRGAVLEMHRQVRVVRYNTSKARPAAGPRGAL